MSLLNNRLPGDARVTHLTCGETEAWKVRCLAFPGWTGKGKQSFKLKSNRLRRGLYSSRKATELGARVPKGGQGAWDSEGSMTLDKRAGSQFSRKT